MTNQRTGTLHSITIERQSCKNKRNSAANTGELETTIMWDTPECSIRNTKGRPKESLIPIIDSRCGLCADPGGPKLMLTYLMGSTQDATKEDADCTVPCQEEEKSRQNTQDTDILVP